MPSGLGICFFGRRIYFTLRGKPGPEVGRLIKSYRGELSLMIPEIAAVAKGK